MSLLLKVVGFLDASDNNNNNNNNSFDLTLSRGFGFGRTFVVRSMLCYGYVGSMTFH